MSPILAAGGVTIRAGARAILNAVSLAIAPGETVALVGPNGAGKSTLLRVLSGELAADAGTVMLRGREPRAYEPRVLALHRAVLSQHTSVAFPFSVAEVVRMGAGDRRGAAVETLIDAALAEVDLAGFRERTITTLSGGEQQRAHVARVLVQLACGEEVHGPGILLLDEPTASLDLRHQLDVLEATRQRAARGFTVVAILHDLNLAALFANRIVVLHDGRIAADGTPEQTITDALLARVFQVAVAVGRAPPAGTPFVLPHAMKVARDAVPE